ncbi:uncharacterized protein LOC105693853 isoform X2 [Athalia rosae]|uniref:uncharacterized protein LOC105693853 isoform X2 n=1 Tax=Athalia rosae TaxID=37344 RepID=UPI002033972B|nr:uncharacterized protein LOC105693853 isoform X2 [Athalia rosae]
MPQPKQISATDAPREIPQTQNVVLLKRSTLDKPWSILSLNRKTEVINVRAQFTDVNLIEEEVLENPERLEKPKPKKRSKLLAASRGRRSQEKLQLEQRGFHSIVIRRTFERGPRRSTVRNLKGKKIAAQLARNVVTSKAEAPVSKCIRFLAANNVSPPTIPTHRPCRRWSIREDRDNFWLVGTHSDRGPCCS